MKHTRTATVDYHGVPLAVEFTYYRGFAGTLESPPEPEDAELYAVKAGAVDVLPLLTEDQCFELSALCVEWVNEDREYQMHEHADMLREERALGNA